MKRALWVVVVVAMLAGCNVTQPPVATPDGDFSALASAVQTIKVLIPTPQATTEIATLEPTLHTPEANPSDKPSDSDQNMLDLVETPNFTSTPYQHAALLSSFIPQMKNTAGSNGLPIGTVAVERDGYVYYTRAVGNMDKSVIYRLERSNGTIIKLRETVAIITQIFLDSSGNLYYVRYKKGEEQYSLLYQYHKGQDILIADSIGYVARIDKANIYYVYDLYIVSGDEANGDIASWTLIDQYNIKKKAAKRIAAIQGNIYPMWFVSQRPLVYFVSEDNTQQKRSYVLNLEDGSIRRIVMHAEHLLVSGEGECLIEYETFHNMTRFYIYNFRTLKKTTCTVPMKPGKISQACIMGSKLYVIDDNSSDKSLEITKSTVYQIDLQSGKLLSATSLDYVSQACLYQGKWYLYTYQLKDNSEYSYMVGQKVRAYDPELNRYTTITSLGDGIIGDDKEFLFEVSGGYVWMILISGCESACYSWWERIPLPVQNTQAPAPLPPTGTSSPEPTVKA